MAHYNITLSNGKELNITDKELNYLPEISKILEKNAWGDGTIGDGYILTEEQELELINSGSSTELADTRDVPSKDDPLRRKIGPILGSLDRKGIIKIEKTYITDENNKRVRMKYLWGHHEVIDEVIEKTRKARKAAYDKKRYAAAKKEA